MLIQGCNRHPLRPRRLQPPVDPAHEPGRTGGRAPGGVNCDDYADCPGGWPPEPFREIPWKNHKPLPRQCLRHIAGSETSARNSWCDLTNPPVSMRLVAWLAASNPPEPKPHGPPARGPPDRRNDLRKSENRSKPLAVPRCRPRQLRQNGRPPRRVREQRNRI